MIEPKLRRAQLHAGTGLAVTAGVTSGSHPRSPAWPGVAAGRWLVQWVPATVFERVILTLLVLGAVYLLLG